MQTTATVQPISGIFIKELKNRFLCEVEIDGKPVVCYVPSSCHLSNFLKLEGKKVLLTPTASPNCRTQYSLLAVPYRRSFIVLNTSLANKAIYDSLHGKRFAFLGKRSEVLREHRVSNYKSDLYIPGTDTLIEIKSVISLEKTGVFPTIYSERSLKQMATLLDMLRIGKRVLYCIVSLNPYVTDICIDTGTAFFQELNECINNGMMLRAYTARFEKGEVKLKKEIPISFL